MTGSRKKVVLLYGGQSVEHGVSVNSARNIFEHIDRSLFEPVPIGITQDGRWFLTTSVTRDIDQGKALGLLLDAQRPGLILLATDDRIKADLVFPVLHGTNGEDGSIQGLVQTVGIPLVGSGIGGSAFSMSKIVAKELLQAADIPTARFLAFAYDDRKKIRYDAIRKQLGSPFMVKSANLGSSVGVSRVKDKKGFKAAVEEAFRYDGEILIEKFIAGRELECAVLGNNPPKASLPGEIVVHKGHDFYTFDAKYVDEKAVSIEVPARLDKAVVRKIQSLAVRAFRALHCEDYARVDMFLGNNGKVYVNEINTIPGFTNASMFPMMWQQHGISFQELITQLITTCLERYAAQERIQRDFASALRF